MTRVANKTRLCCQNRCGKRHPDQRLSEELTGTYKLEKRQNSHQEGYNLAATQTILPEQAVGRGQHAADVPRGLN